MATPQRRDRAGRTLITLAVDAWTLDQLLTFNAGAEDLEDTDREPEPEEERVEGMLPRRRSGWRWFRWWIAPSLLLNSLDHGPKLR